MTLILVGATFHDNSLQDLEILERNAEAIRNEVFSSDFNQSAIEGGVLLSTCNRFEIYVDTEEPDVSQKFLINRISKITDISPSSFFTKDSEDVIEHLFKVASGLDSMIIGEVEIAGQVKRAFAQSQSDSQTSRIIEALFQRAAEISKKIATETGLGAAGRSLITSSIQILKDEGFDLKDKKVLVIGTGAYARVVIAALEREGVAAIHVFSNSDRAEAFSETHSTIPVAPNGLHELLPQIDLIVACSGIHGTIINTEDIKKLDKTFLPIIDLSLARDVEKSVELLPNIFSIDLELIQKEAPVEHFEVLDSALKVVRESTVKFQNDLKSRRNDPFVRMLRQHVEKIVAEEVQRVRNKKGDEIANQVAHSLHTVTKSIFHKPTIAARENALNDESDEYQKSIQVLFGLSTYEDSDE